MPRFNSTTQKYDQFGRKIPKGRDGIKTFMQQYPDTMIFDSKSEYLLYEKFKQMEQENLIHNLKCKQKFDLVPKTKWWNNIKQKFDIVRELSYICDFTFTRDNKEVVVDCKGWALRLDKKTNTQKYKAYYDEIYKIKKKLFLHKYPQYIFEEM
jgi:Protein of unknown function (DUF1064)